MTSFSRVDTKKSVGGGGGGGDSENVFVLCNQRILQTDGRRLEKRTQGSNSFSRGSVPVFLMKPKAVVILTRAGVQIIFPMVLRLVPIWTIDQVYLR